MKNKQQLHFCVSLMTMVVLLFVHAAAAEAQRELDSFNTAVNEASSAVTSLKKCTDEVDRVVNALANDSNFASSVFKAVTAGNSAGLQTLLSQRVPSCTTQASIQDKDFLFSVVFGNPQTGNHFFLCFASRGNPAKCKDGTRFDVNITLN